jgi:hypothetical protein
VDSIERARQRIRQVIAGSRVPEDSRHADNTLEWLLRLQPDAGDALQLAALAHDIDRANEETKVGRTDFDDYDTFKAAHARNSAEVLRPILTACGVERDVVDEACRLVAVHEAGGDPGSDLLKDADSISYFDVNLQLYYQREGRDEALRRSRWGYRRLSSRARGIVKQIVHNDKALECTLMCLGPQPPGNPGPGREARHLPRAEQKQSPACFPPSPPGRS